jgi:DNA-binding SARP family transcriptional activator
VWRLLADDPCREDAHRLAMRCYMQRGQRAMALHQYHVCVDILRMEFDASPEAATTALFDQIRLQPESI